METAVPFVRNFLSGSTSLLDVALALGKAGIAVFPCLYAKKVPAIRGGFYAATTNPATIRRWFAGAFPRNLAARTGNASGVWVVDVDAIESVKTLEDQHGSLPLTLQSRTSRGRHFWFRTTASPIPSSAGRVAPRVDIKAENGYVITPPSIHPDGVVYEWLNNEPIADAPRWLVELARKPPQAQSVASRPASPEAFSGRPGGYGAAALKAEIDTLANAPRGSRNHALNRASFALHQLVAGGELDAGEVEQRLIGAATTNGLLGEDGLRSVMATIRSGARAGLKLPRSRNGGR
jgi:Bifunctional DNA primase/polymerase, N-terminal